MEMGHTCIPSVQKPIFPAPIGPRPLFGYLIPPSLIGTDTGQLPCHPPSRLRNKIHFKDLSLRYPSHSLTSAGMRRVPA